MMNTVKNSYAVALTFPGELEVLMSRLREAFRPHLRSALVPHITLVYSFQPSDSIEKVVERLESVASKAKPFIITLEGIEYFQTVNNVAYIAIKNKDTVKAFMHDIVIAIKDTVTGYYAGDTYHPDHLIPHMTIGEKIPAHVFPEIKKRFTEIKITREIEVTNFALAGESAGLWEQLKTFKLGG
jgi:2'-5' RNA ligase